jgi:hypothetical protein
MREINQLFHEIHLFHEVHLFQIQHWLLDIYKWLCEVGAATQVEYGTGTGLPQLAKSIYFYEREVERDV